MIFFFCRFLYAELYTRRWAPFPVADDEFFMPVFLPPLTIKSGIILTSAVCRGDRMMAHLVLSSLHVLQDERETFTYLAVSSSIVQAS